jgi:dethiobiotin synthetase
MSRPDRLVLVTGTGTEIGKTWWTAQLATALRAQGFVIAARKPVQSFVATDHSTDADVLAAATGEDPRDVCPPARRFEVPMAPPMAADVLGRPPFTIAELAAELAWPDACVVGLVEGAGGPRSPLAADGDTVDLVHALRPDFVVLVADAGLGTINAVLLSAAALDGEAVVVALNRFDPRDDLHVRNHQWLVDHGVDLVTDPVELATRLW